LKRVRNRLVCSWKRVLPAALPKFQSHPDMRPPLTAALLGFVAILCGALHQSWPEWWWRFREPAPEIVFERRITPFLRTSCLECHDSSVRKGDFVLERLGIPSPGSEEREAWQRVFQHVGQQLMPPLDAEQPAPAERERFLVALDRLLHPVDPRNPDPGRVVLRRMNRDEYRNTVRDLFGVAFDPAADFPDDDTGYGFDRIGSVLSVSPLLFERYLAAAEQVAAAVVPDSRPPPRVSVARPDDWKGAVVSGAVASLYSPRTMTWETSVPADGRYRLHLGVSQDRAGDEPARFSVSAGGNVVARLEANRGRDRPRLHTIELDLESGTTAIGIAFLNDFFRPAAEGNSAQDRNFHLNSAELEGPFFPAGLDRTTVPLPDWIQPQREGESRDAWFARNLAPVMRKAFRRTPAPDEVARIARLAEESERAGDSPAAAYQVALQAVLTSPAFLFIGETSPQTAAVASAGGKGRRHAVRPLSGPALASRLSYFLWGGPPDDRLLELAESGRLEAALPAETARMLGDPRARRFVDSFAGQWLEVRNLSLRTPDPSVFPEWSPELAASMQEETLRFFADFLTNGRPVVELLMAEHTFVDARLAAFYGLPPPQGEGFQRVVQPPERRAGLLGQAGVLTVTSYPNRTSPVLRGKFVLEKLLGTPPPPPPPNIPSLSEHADGVEPLGLRGRLELHRSNPSCASCHARIDPIGFALENFDAIGRRREVEGGLPIDTSGRLVTGESVDSAVSLAAALAASGRDEFTANFSRTLLTYALGRGLDYYDRPTVERIEADAARRGHTLPAYIDAVVASLAFRFQRDDPAPAPQSFALGP
jgi:hypothetical protein